MALVLTNNASALTSGSLLTGDITVTIASGGSKFPTVTGSDYFYAVLQDASNNFEIVKVTAHAAASNSFTVTRAQEGTAAFAFGSGVTFALRPTVQTLKDIVAASVNFAGNNTWTGTNTFSAALSIGADVTLTGTGRRITGLMDSGTNANNVTFQTSTVNALTNMQVAPNGTSQISALTLYNSSDLANASTLQFLTTGSVLNISSQKGGTASFLPIVFTAPSFQLNSPTATGPRITGDFSNSVTHASRPIFQTSVASGNTAVGAMPASGGSFGQFVAYSTSDPDNSNYLNFASNNVSGSHAIAVGYRVAGGNQQPPTGFYPLNFQFGSYIVGSIQTDGSWNLGQNLSSSPSLVASAVPSATRSVRVFGSVSTNPIIDTTAGSLCLNPASGTVAIASATATPAGGTAGLGLTFGSAGPGVFFGSGAPALSAAQGSLYLRTDGTAGNRLYVNNNGSTGWTPY